MKKVFDRETINNLIELQEQKIESCRKKIESELNGRQSAKMYELVHEAESRAEFISELKNILEILERSEQRQDVINTLNNAITYVKQYQVDCLGIHPNTKVLNKEAESRIKEYEEAIKILEREYANDTN